MEAEEVGFSAAAVLDKVFDALELRVGVDGLTFLARSLTLSLFEGTWGFDRKAVVIEVCISVKVEYVQ